METAIAELEPFGMTVRLAALLERSGILWVRDLEGVRPQELMELDGFGKTEICKIRRILWDFFSHGSELPGSD